MKKFICLLLLLTAMYMNAQEVHFIPRAGLTLANTTNTGGSMKPGLNIGVAAEFMLNPAFALETGLYYSMQGAKQDYPYYSLEHNYLNLPILAKVYGNRHWSFFAGPQIGIKVSGNKRVYATDDEHHKIQLIDEDMTKVFDVAAVIGAGYQFDLGLVVSANVNIGLLGKAKDHYVFGKEEFPTNGESCKNMVVQLNFGYRF